MISLKNFNSISEERKIAKTVSQRSLYNVSNVEITCFYYL